MDLCTVISENFIPQAINLIQSYRVNSYDRNVYLYYFNTNPDSLKVFPQIFGDKVKLIEVKKTCAHALDPRVFFYKTYAINDCLLNLSEGLIYSDSANCFVKSTESIEQDLVDDSLFMAYPYPGLTNQNWVTRKCLLAMDAPGAEFMPQYWAGFQVYKKTPQNINFVEEMYSHMMNPDVALPDTTKRYPDGTGSSCIEHRQDQAVLSVLLHKHNRHQAFDPIKNSKYGDWQTMVEFDKDYKHDFNQMILSPRESKFNNFRFIEAPQ